MWAKIKPDTAGSQKKKLPNISTWGKKADVNSTWIIVISLVVRM